jgi:hypothetical protein
MRYCVAYDTSVLVLLLCTRTLRVRFSAVVLVAYRAVVYLYSVLLLFRTGTASLLLLR